MLSNLLAARAQMGTSLMFHIIFSILGVGLPLMLCIAEGIAIRKKDPVWMVLARRWSTAAAIVFAIGAVSGTIVEFELGLLWPTYIKYTGAIVGPLFAFEGFAFFIEAIFFGIYLYGWNRLSPMQHWLCSFPIWIGGAASAWFITTTNAWMNTPTGFEISNGKIVGINSAAAIFNPSMPYETVHMILACYVACGFGVAAIYAVSMLRGHLDEYRRKGMMLGLVLALIATPLQIISGDSTARALETQQPIKLASMEGVFKTSSHVPVHVGGIPDTQNDTYYVSIDIPDGLSLLVGGNPNTVVKGLNSFPKQDEPNAFAVAMIHLSFDGMVGSGFFILLIAILFWFLYFKRKRVVPEGKLMLGAITLSGILGFVAIELGWTVTEEGRQPWVIYNVLLTSKAVTTATFLNISFLVFSIIYVILAITMIVLLLRQARRPLPPMVWEKVVSSPRSENHGGEAGV